MNSGCICCSLVGDFGKALQQVIAEFNPDRVIIEPSGVGKLSDVIAAVEKVTNEEVTLGYTVAVADAGKVKVYMKNFGEFYNNQIETASTIILSRTDSVPQSKLDTGVALIREHNNVATLITTPWNELTGEQLIAAMEGKATLAEELARLELERLAEEEHHHHHHDDEHECCCGHHHEEHEHHHHHGEDHECCCGHHHEEHEHHHHHDEDHECCCGHHHEEHEHHHHHDEDHECCCGHHHEEHEHHHEHGEHCSCGHDHHHHHADEVFTSWGRETHKKFERATIETALKELDSGKFGMVLRAKGILPCVDGSWIHFDMVPEEINIREGGADINGKLCVIGANLDEAGVAALFGV